jgi:hypothetical protein
MALKTKPLADVRKDVPTAAAAQGELVRINFLVPSETRKAWKKLAVDKDLTLQQLIIDSMNRNFNEVMK